MNSPNLSASLFVIALAAFGLPSAAAAQESFTGRVIDERSKTGVAGATVSIAGYPGTIKTDSEGRFTWSPRPEAPFQVIIVLPAGQVVSPVTVERADGQVELTVNPLRDESLTVVGVAPSVTTTPAAGMTLLSSRQIAQRAPENLMQALETVPGVNQVSEGHASVPAIRGLARGRTLLLIDGGRVTSERRVGPSATFADPATFEGIDVARGPGSVAYGSDALGGVISVRTRRAEPGLAAAGPRQRHARRRCSGSARRGGSLEGPVSWRRDLPGARPLGGRLGRSGRRRDPQFGMEGPWLPGPGRSSGRQGHALGRPAERLRQGHRTAAQQLERGPLLLPLRGFAPVHQLVRAPQRRRISADRRDRVRRHVRAADRSGPLCHRHDRTQHRARRRLGQRLPRQGQRRRGPSGRRAWSSAST